MSPDLLRATRHSVGGRLFVALWGGLALVDLLRPTAGTFASGVIVAVLVVGCGIGQPRAAALAIAGTGWLVINGFVLHRYGVLGLGPSSWWPLGVLLVLVLAVSWRTSGGGRR
jgi:hypothetical protein